jgi:hypothetical protein
MVTILTPTHGELVTVEMGSRTACITVPVVVMKLGFLFDRSAELG